MLTVSIVGMGYMGLPMACVVANAGHTVVGVDINPAVVDAVNMGQCPFTEVGMAEALTQAHGSGRLKAVLAPEAADVFVISVPTPVDHATHKPDMAMVRAAAKAIAPVLQNGNCVVLESTVPVGATETDVRDVIEDVRPELVGKIHYAFCPERAIPGQTLYELVNNDRSIGGLTPEASAKVKDFYATFVKGELLETSTRNAELVKLVENASRDVQIAFANELDMVCKQHGLNVWEVIALANRHPRVNILQPGPGVGGHCIAVDPWFIVDSAPDVTPLMRTARTVNDGKPAYVVSQILDMIKDTDTVALMGMAYKPNVDDLRESPSIEVYRQLKGRCGNTVFACEPHVDAIDDMNLVALEKALGADVIVFLTGHTVFKEIPQALLDGKAVLDICGCRVN